MSKLHLNKETLVRLTEDLELVGGGEQERSNTTPAGGGSVNNNKNNKLAQGPS